MKLIIERINNSFWLLIPLVLEIGIWDFDKSIHIQRHDTYLVIGFFQIAVVLSVLLGLKGIIYWIVRKKALIRWMTAAHFYGTTLAFFLIMIVGLTFNKVLSLSFGSSNIATQLIFISIAAIVVNYIILLVNVVIGLIRNVYQSE